MEKTKKNSILIVDDDESNILALTHILASDYDIMAAKDGQDAIEVAEEFLPDVVLLDVIMPEMDGYAVIGELKKSGKTKDIPVIFITGLSSADDEEKGLNLGAADYISKPFSPATVKLRVQNQIKIIDQTRLIIKKETAEKSSRERSEFLSRMSHEMRTPMNVITGMIALSRNTAQLSERDEMLEKMSNASEKLMKLIDDVLDMSDIEDGRLRLSFAEFHFGDMVREIISTAEPELNAKKQLLATEIDPSIPDAIVGDKRRLAQVILNLLSNANKFTPDQGSIKLKASACEVDNETLTLRIEVADNGIGISKEQLERIFIPFEQADGGIDRKFGGAGLGLAMSRHLVSIMGGEIWAESDPGKGSVFIFTVKTEVKQPEKMDDSRISLEGKIAMLVEDVEINREIVMAMLEYTGLEFICAENGREAVDLFSSDPGKYDVILMDINMPEMDGLEATRRIRALDVPEQAQVPIIAMTANVLASEVRTYLDAGMDAHIGKPIDYDKLVNTLFSYLT